MITMGSVLPVGTIIHSMLSTTQFASEYGSNWVLADGRSVAGSLYAQVTGISNIPDLRGGFLRAKGATLNPDGDLALGTLTADKIRLHDHTGPFSGASSGPVYNFDAVGAATVTITNTGSQPKNIKKSAIPEGGNETAPVSVTVNVFIRIN